MIEGGAQLFIAKTVLLEFEWVLRGAYGHPPAAVCRVLDHLLSLPQIESQTGRFAVSVCTRSKGEVMGMGRSG